MLFGVFSVAFLLIAGRLTQIDVFGGTYMAAYWRGEVTRTVPLQGLRGAILDRDGHLLAMSLSVNEVVADDLQIRQPAAEAAELAPVLGVSASSLRPQLSQRSGYVVIDRTADAATAAKVSALDAPGITVQPASARRYPDGTLGAPVIGAVHADGSGASGLEYQYDRLLAGQSGQQIQLVGAAGEQIPGGIVKNNPAHPGTGLQLTLSRALQYETEQALGAEIQASHSTWGSAVILDSKTGDILAMANMQATSATDPTPVQASSNLAVSQVFEPGSVAKLATFAGALSRNLITPETVVNVPNQINIDGSTFHDAESHPDENLTATQVLAQSSNIGTIKIAAKLGPENLYRYLTAFGFGSPTGLTFPGGSPGIVRPVSTWSPTAMGSVPIGQDESVSVLQLADAYNVVANGGVFVPPRLVQAETEPNGLTKPLPAPATHRVISTAVAAELNSMLQQVVSSSGTAPAAAIPGYSVAGKTGTANIPYLNKSGYQPGAFMAVFAGMVPATNPAITAVVALSHPQQIYGGTVAAPVFAQIANDALRYLQVPPDQPLSGPTAFSTGPSFGAGLPTAPSTASSASPPSAGG